MNEAIKKFEYEMIDELEHCENTVQAADIMKKALTKLGMPDLGAAFIKFARKRSNLHH